MPAPIAAPAPGCPTAAPIIAPPPAPRAAPPRVPFSRVESGSPLHPARMSVPASARHANRLLFLRIREPPSYSTKGFLFGFLLRFKLLNLLPLLFEFLLLLLDPRLGLLIGVL